MTILDSSDIASGTRSYHSSLTMRKISPRSNTVSLPPRTRTGQQLASTTCRSHINNPFSKQTDDYSCPPIHPPATFSSVSSPSPSPTISLLRLSFAQCRKDIRWRQEGFEMVSRDTDSIPFALRTHTLVPLDVAYARNDIRRRNEAYESCVVSVDADSQHLPSSTRISLLSSSMSCPTIISCQSTLPSIYSHPSFPLDDLADEDDSVIELYDVYNGLSLYELGYGASGDGDLTHFSGSSFDEESFLRMAQTSLDW